MKGWEDDAARQIEQLAPGAFNADSIRAYLRGSGALDFDPSKLAEGVEISDVASGAGRIRATARERIDRHRAAMDAFRALGEEVDRRMGAAIPRWQRQLRKRPAPAAPPADPAATD